MGFLDIFKKKERGQVSGEKLTLEQLLRKAATEPIFRAEFYKRLLTEELVVLTQNSNLKEGNHTLQQDASVNIVSYPDGKIPVFTAIERIFDKGIVKEQVECMQCKGQDLFELAKGATFLLNPYSDYGKELLPGEIEQLLNGTILTNNSKTLTIAKDTPIQIGQPATYPTEIVDALKQLFVDRPNVRSAYLGWIFSPTNGEPPHYIFALDANRDIQRLTQEAGFIVKQFLAEHEFADFIKIDEKGGGINDYFLKQTKPFYEKNKI